MQGRSHTWDFSVGLKDHINKLAVDVCGYMLISKTAKRYLEWCCLICLI